MILVFSVGTRKWFRGSCGSGFLVTVAFSLGEEYLLCDCMLETDVGGRIETTDKYFQEQTLNL